MRTLGQRYTLQATSRQNGWQWMFRLGAEVEIAKVTERQQIEDNPCRRTAKMARLEAVLLVTDQALSLRKLAQLATLADVAEVQQLVHQLNAAYDRSGCAFRIEQVATGCRLMTRPQFAMWLDKLHHRQAEMKLSSPMMETLSIVAYRQPITRAEIERIRGVQSAEMLKQLMERGLVKIGGEEDSLGRPFLYVTTRRFLETYGLRDLGQMPMAETLRRVVDPQLKLALPEAEEEAA